MKLEQLLQQLHDIDAKIDALLLNDELDDEQRAEHEALLAERGKTTLAIERENDRAARQAEREQLESAREKADARAEADRQERIRGQRSVAPAVARVTIPDAPKVAATVKEAMRKLANGCEVSEKWVRDPYKGFYSHTDFLRAVMNAGRGGKIDARLKPLSRERREEDADWEPGSGRGCDYLVPAAFTPARPQMIGGLYNHFGRQMTAGSDEAGTYSDPYGGFLAGRGQFTPELLRVNPEGDPMGAYTRKIPMDVPSITFPARVDKNHTSSVSGGLRVYRRSETQTVSSSRMELEEIELKASPLFGVAYATEELLARSLISFLALLQAGFSDEFNAKLIRERLEGTGVGQYEGVLNSDCIISVSAEQGQAADTIMKENIDKMRSRCWGYGSAIWLANHDTYPMLRSLVQQIGTGGSVVSYFSSDVNGGAMLDGRPLFFTEFCPKLGDTGDLLLGNWREYLEGQLSPLQNDESMHVRFLEHERTFKFWMENAGKCWWRSALTPAKSSQTLSPFVKLAAR